ncbi:MAG TPA: energy transducer TonB [Rhizomicrobium sp.]|jgi:protein TonB|nr:energy transducer TonB [Rhizomicrobium sp.]
MQQPSHDLRGFGGGATATPRRIFSVGAVVLLHLILIYALASGLAAQLVQKMPEILKADVVPPQMPKDQVLPPPPPQLEKPPPPFVPPPEINVTTEAPATNTITAISTPPPPATPAKPSISAPASIGKPHSCGQNYYPAIGIRLNWSGVTGVGFKIGTDGSVSDAHVTSSSGHQELDDAAIRCASSWRYKPAIQNNQPVEVPWQTNVKWDLKG